MTQESMAYADAAKVRAKKEAEKSSNADEDKVEKKEIRKKHALSQLIRPSVFL